jgi:hypothetical protein
MNAFWDIVTAIDIAVIPKGRRAGFLTLLAQRNGKPLIGRGVADENLIGLRFLALGHETPRALLDSSSIA